MHGAHRPQRLRRLLLLRRDGQRQAVDPHVLVRDAVGARSGQNAPGNGYAPFGRLGDAVCVEREADDGCAVFFHDGQHAREHLRVAVHGVDRGLAVIHPQARLQRVGVRGVELQRDGQGALQRLHHTRQHGDLVHAGVADVYVQNVRARVLLLDAHVQNVVQVVFQQRLLEALFAGGVDALADHAHAVDAQRRDGRAHEAGGVVCALGGRLARKHGV